MIAPSAIRDSTINSVDPYSMKSEPTRPSTTAIQIKVFAAVDRIAIAMLVATKIPSAM